MRVTLMTPTEPRTSYTAIRSHALAGSPLWLSYSVQATTYTYTHIIIANWNEFNVAEV